MPIDPFSLTGLAFMGHTIMRGYTCPVCKNVKFRGNWQSWSCCRVKMCADCAADTEHTKSCRKCGHSVQ